MADLQPELANARLSMLKKQPAQTFQALEGEINELVFLAARGEKGDKSIWMKNRKIEVFKQAILEKDRTLIYRENQSRNISGLGDMNLSQAVDFLIKNYSEANAFAQANKVKYEENGDIDSIQRITETKPPQPIGKKQKKKELEKARKALEEQQLKDEIFQIYENQKNQMQQSQTGRGRGRGRGFRGFRGFNRGRGNRGNGSRDWNNGQNNPNNWNGNQSWKTNGNGNGQRGNGGQRGGGTPRKFITPEMVGVGKNNCLKCNSPDHRFQEQDRCIYGQSNLMTRACPNCHEGGHHSAVCIKNQKSTIGAPAPKEAVDPKFSTWPEQTKMAEEQSFYNLFDQKNGLGPSLFPQ